MVSNNGDNNKTRDKFFRGRRGDFLRRWKLHTKIDRSQNEKQDDTSHITLVYE